VESEQGKFLQSIWISPAAKYLQQARIGEDSKNLQSRPENPK
jgi:hypothetical protein